MAARRFASHGWAVTPGGYFDGERMACDRADCWATSCHPLLNDWESQSSTWEAQLDEWWQDRPHALLLPTGHQFDVLEVPALLGCAAHVRGPIAHLPNGRLMFMVKPGAALLPELDHRVDVVHHGRGSWIPAPPTFLPEGEVRWRVTPQAVNWQVPDSIETQRTLVRALVSLDATFLDLPLAARRRIAPPRIASTSLELSLRRAA